MEPPRAHRSGMIGRAYTRSDPFALGDVSMGGCDPGRGVSALSMHTRTPPHLAQWPGTFKRLTPSSGRSPSRSLNREAERLSDSLCSERWYSCRTRLSLQRFYFTPSLPQLSNGAYILRDIGLSMTEWRELNLLRKPIGRREITFALDEYTTDNERCIVRRSNLCHSLRRRTFPAWPAHKVLASPGSCGACADVGKIRAV